MLAGATRDTVHTNRLQPQPHRRSVRDRWVPQCITRRMANVGLASCSLGSTHAKRHQHPRLPRAGNPGTMRRERDGVSTAVTHRCAAGKGEGYAGRNR